MNEKYGLILHWAYNVSSAVAPLIIIPSLLHALGTEEYGSLALIQILSFATLSAVDFGLSSIGPKLLAESDNHRDFSKTAFSLVFIHTSIWGIASCVGSIWLYWSNPTYVGNYWLSQVAVLSAFLPPAYLLIYRKAQSLYGLVGIFSRIAHTAIVLATVHEAGDTWKYFASNAIITTIGSFVLIRTYCRDCFKPDFSNAGVLRLKRTATRGWTQFARRAASVPITLLTPWILEWSTDKTNVALYSLVDKMRTVTWQAISPVISSFASVHYLRRQDKLSDRDYVAKRRRAHWILGLVCLLLVAPSWMATHSILEFLQFGGTPLAVWAWRLGATGVIPAVFLAYAMAIHSPDLGTSRFLTTSTWLLTVLLIAAALLSIGRWGLLAAVPLMAAWESMAYLLIKIARRTSGGSN